MSARGVGVTVLGVLMDEARGAAARLLNAPVQRSYPGDDVTLVALGYLAAKLARVEVDPLVRRASDERLAPAHEMRGVGASATRGGA